MRKLVCALVLLVGCDEDEAAAPEPIDRSLFDASAPRAIMDGGQYVARPVDAAAVGPSCPTLDVCTDSQPGLLYNVCLAGAPSGSVVEPACLVDPNGALYLAPLAVGQRVMMQGWTQSTDGTLSAADQVRCQDARAALLAVDAAMPPKCAGAQ